MPTRTRDVTLRRGHTLLKGLRLHHLEWGGPDWPPLVLLHGIRAHAYIWSRAAPYLAPPYRLLAPDFRGHGDSDWSDDGYGTPHYVADFAAWVDAQRLERFPLVGHSAGGRVAVSYAATRPERVERLVVVDMGPDVGPTQPFDPVLAARPQRTFDDLHHAIRVLRERYPTIDAAYLRRLARWSVRPGPDGRLTWKWDKRVRGQMRPADEFRADLRALRCPTLIVRGGEAAALSAASAAEMQALIPGESHVVVVPRTSHVLAEERPATFAAVVREFLSGAAEPTDNAAAVGLGVTPDGGGA
ncbi:MAG TPA: alpha/beta hydrolase [Chloroflexota bacterium]|nr:alpha/beta hydrolase [Chloroflexota bacterium]